MVARRVRRSLELRRVPPGCDGKACPAPTAQACAARSAAGWPSSGRRSSASSACSSIPVFLASLDLFAFTLGPVGVLSGTLFVGTRKHGSTLLFQENALWYN